MDFEFRMIVMIGGEIEGKDKCVRSFIFIYVIYNLEGISISESYR